MWLSRGVPGLTLSLCATVSGSGNPGPGARETTSLPNECREGGGKSVLFVPARLTSLHNAGTMRSRSKGGRESRVGRRHKVLHVQTRYALCVTGGANRNFPLAHYCGNCFELSDEIFIFEAIVNLWI